MDNRAVWARPPQCRRLNGSPNNWVATVHQTVPTQMPNFDYITSADFRVSLESDYAEMRRCAEANAWKSAQVLAGSIVESLLIDYLSSTTNPTRPAKDSLKLDLGEVISICKSEGVLSDRTADLCSVIRSYRNLIHPGRLVRLKEQPPSKTTCDIAIALIDLIVDDIAKTRRAAVGLTAEQILSKIIRDPGCLTILKHLLAEASEQQRERLLIELIPATYFDQLANDDPFDETADRLSSAHRITFESVDKSVKERVAQEFVRILKEEDGQRVNQYRAAFFRASDLAYVSQQNQQMVKEHLLGAAPSIHTFHSIHMLEGIGPYLQPDDCVKWLDLFVRTLGSATAKDPVKNKTREALIDTVFFTSKEFDARVTKRLDEWLAHYQRLNNRANAALVKGLQEEIAAIATP